MASGPGEVVRPVAPTTTLTERSTRTWARVAALLVYAGALVVWIRAFGVPSDTVQIFLWLWLVTIAWNVEASPRYHVGFLRDWWVPVAALVVYFYSRGLADEFGFAPHFQMPITVDTWLGGGELPSERLQAALCGTPCDPNSDPRWYDVLFTSVYTTHFVVGLTIAMVLWMRNRGEWMKWMRRYVGINIAALVIYILYPMAPPWMASEQGYLAGEVERITHRGWADTGLARFHLVLTGVGNPVAAMPALHARNSVRVAIKGIPRRRAVWRGGGGADPPQMGVARVYDGEHYLIDIIAGAALAVAVLAACSFWERSRGT